MSSSRKSSSNANAVHSPMDYAQAVDAIRRSDNFQTFFAKAIEKIEQFDSDKDWARQATLAYRRKFVPSAKFVTVYYAFLNEAEKHQEGYDSESVGDEENSVASNDTYERDGFVVDDDECESVESEESEDEWDDQESESIASESEAEEEEEEPKRKTQNVFANDGQPTDAETNHGQRMLHKFILKEYNSDYEALQQEAEEDSSKDAMTADERFQWECAKKLSRKTGIRAKEIYPVVGAWLHEHHNA
jgi:hypothetical protein